MKISGFLKQSLSDYPGCVGAVVFTQGCNFNCPFCHNRWLIPNDSSKEYLSPREIITLLKDRKKFIDGVVISGGEPTLQNGLEDFIRELKSMRYRIKLDTNGSRPEVIQNLMQKNLLDYIAMDIKAPFSKYPFLAGTDCDLPSIQNSIGMISQSGISHHFRTTFYKKLLSSEDLEIIKAFLPSSSKYVIQPFKKPLEINN